MNRSLKAPLLMLASTVGFGLMAITIRLASKTEPTWEVAFFRNLFGGLAALPVIFMPLLRQRATPRELAAGVKSNQLGRYFIRCLIGVVSMFCGFWAIANLPLSQAIALAYSSPIFATIAAALLLGEKVRARRWMAVVIGFIGMLVIVRPWSHAFSIGALVAISAAVITAIVAIQIKQLTKNDTPNTIVFWTYAFWIPMSLVPALFVWHWPQGQAWVWLAASGILGTVGQLLWTRALDIGDVSALTPISFVQLPIVTFAGWALFGESIDGWTLGGAAIILSATAYISHREAKLARQNKSMQPSSGAEPGGN